MGDGLAVEWSGQTIWNHRCTRMHTDKKDVIDYLCESVCICGSNFLVCPVTLCHAALTEIRRTHD